MNQHVDTVHRMESVRHGSLLITIDIGYPFHEFNFNLKSYLRKIGCFNRYTPIVRLTSDRLARFC